MVLKNVLMIAASLTILFLLFLYPFLYPFVFQLPEKEVLVIGLDGGDHEIFQSLMEKNKLPNIKRLIAEGTFTTFNTTGKLDSYSAWNSLAKCNETSLWDKLKGRNVTFGTLYWPNVPEGGLFMVPDEFEGRKEWPEEIYDSKALLLFKNMITEFFRKVYWLKVMLPQNKAEKDLVYEFYLLDRKAREFFYLREKFKPEVSFLVLSSPLRIEQYFWIYAHPDKFGSYITEREKERYGKVIENYLIELDDFLGKVNKPNKIVIVVSNRGVKEMFPPKIVDKIDINKILKEVGMLEFDYRGEIDFSKTKAYTLEEGLDQELKIFINEKNFMEVKEKLKEAFGESKSLPSGQKIFIVKDSKNGISLKRNISSVIEDDRFSILDKIYNFNDFILRRTISVVPEEKGFVIINKKINLPGNTTSKDFCDILFNLIS
jgi:predicted AlkP superfamily phosphohydrolase/phosphomutase